MPFFWILFVFSFCNATLFHSTHDSFSGNPAHKLGKCDTLVPSEIIHKSKFVSDQDFLLELIVDSKSDTGVTNFRGKMELYAQKDKKSFEISGTFPEDKFPTTISFGGSNKKDQHSTWLGALDCFDYYNNKLVLKTSKISYNLTEAHDDRHDVSVGFEFFEMI